jgi:hypothetical protein
LEIGALSLLGIWSLGFGISVDVTQEWMIAASTLLDLEHNIHCPVVARLRRSVGHPSLRQGSASIENLIESGRWITKIDGIVIRIAGGYLARPIGNPLLSNAGIVFSRPKRGSSGAGVEVAADKPRQRAYFPINRFHRSDV